MKDIPGHADTGCSTGIVPLVHCFARRQSWRDVVKERPVEHHLHMRIGEAQQRTDSGDVISCQLTGLSKSEIGLGAI